MRKAYRIKKNEEFQAVFKKGKSFANRQFVLYFYPKPNQTHFRIGLSVGKRIGNAVVRNQVKRYLRQAFLELEDCIKQDFDYVVIARNPAKDLSFFEVKKSLTHIFRKSKLFSKVKC
ncbi:ribonuclease P protein component [Salinibacillus xinjiangensis]|uniref:Ribonuclease P protein component n=1 Tax=Salinibacillus xinjiangensis TaxID=1229268 RepID=A0A6G1XAI5_9BACI|nr:ribonuclease P protein component [Salinibacillus xinjiangensis]MRG87952.1 ribonuclease P protein component [Salinibacillus xinjiangensis]